jgi:hypothetical protein
MTSHTSLCKILKENHFNVTDLRVTGKSRFQVTVKKGKDIPVPGRGGP